MKQPISSSTNRARVACYVAKAMAVGDGRVSGAISHLAGLVQTVEVQSATEILKTGLSALNRSDSAALLNNAGSDLMLLVRPLTILGRLTGIRRVIPDIPMLTGTVGTSAYWSGEGRAIPLSKPTFTSERMSLLKVTAATVITRELAQSARVDAVDSVGADLAGALIAESDLAFIDATNPGVADIKPAAVTSGATQISSTGNDVTSIDNDIASAIDDLITGGSTLEHAAWVCHPSLAVALAKKRTTQGTPAYPFIHARGGQLAGLPVLCSGAVPYYGSPTLRQLTLVDGARIRLTENDEIVITAGREVAVEMADNPSSSSVTPTATATVSIWQTNSIAIKAERPINWIRTDANACCSIVGIAI